MCLKIIEQKYSIDKPLVVKEKGKKYKIGWKLVKPGRKKTEWEASHQYTRYPYNKWLIEDSDDEIRSDDFKYNPKGFDFYETYPMGFHICKTREDARKYKKEFSDIGFKVGSVVKVRYQDIVAIGTQFGCNVIVARKIFVERNK